MELHGNISRNSYGNAVVGRYGGCFEEDVQAYVQENRMKSSHGFGCTGEVCTNSQCEKGQCTAPKRLANFGWWKCQKPQLNISQKELTSLLQTTSRFNIKSMIIIYPKEGRSRRHKYPARSLDLNRPLCCYELPLDRESYQVPLHLQQLVAFVVRPSFRETIH